MSQPAPQILVIGGEPSLTALLVGAFEPEARLRFASDAVQARQMLSVQPADFVLVDLEASPAAGFDFLKRLRESPPDPAPLVHVLAPAGNTEVKLRAYELGALDCVDKPPEPRLFRARLRASWEAKRKFDQLLRRQQELMEACQAAEASARAKSDFLSAMSHEIRTPMNGVIAMASLLMETPLTAEQRGYLETIHASGESLLAIINDILDLSKIEAGRMELDVRPFDLRARLEETLDLLATKAAEKHLDLIYHCDPAVPQLLEGDSLRLGQVLMNLLGNALKFTGKGGVFLQVKLLPPPAGPAPEPASLSLHFSVQDSGVGISPEKLARLFQPFIQAEASTARQYGGTGLGLAISKRLVELMGGKMWAESVPGKGSTFHFTLPLRAAEPVRQPALAGPQSKLAGLRVLIVEDNALARRVLAEQTAQWGLSPCAVENAAQAIEELKKGDPFDVAVVDAELPGTDGVAVVQQIHQVTAAALLPVVLLTPLGARPSALGSGAAFLHFTGKPIKPALLCAAIERALFSSKKTEAAPRAPQNGAEQTLAARIPWRILLVDDNAINQKVAARILQQLGYRPDLAANGREALAALDKQPYDLVFMDVMMPEMDGYEATRLIRERENNAASPRRPRTLIVAMTAHALPSDRERCLAAGMDDYLAKPIRPNDVRGIIEKWAAQRAAAGSAPAQSSPAIAPAPPVSESAASALEPPVEMSRLIDLTDGNAESLRELLEMFYRQTEQQLDQIENAVRAGNADEVRRVAHSGKGASATLGMAPLAAVLFQLEQLGKSGALSGAEQLCVKARREYQTIRDFLSAHPLLTGTPPLPTSP
jgi:signal transduction histidine kinase/AmiR/NasT family two-component response regulator/HPt (histidine-containing phosphotransfer) domain-containing protein